MGRAPRLHPPGAVIDARPVRARSGARKNSDERMRRIKGGGTSLAGACAGRMASARSPASTRQPQALQDARRARHVRQLRHIFQHHALLA